MSTQRRLETITGGAAVAPLAVLFGLNLVDELDRIAFAALTPEIRDHFELSDVGIGAVGVLTAISVLLLALPLGSIADRVNRIRLGALGALVWATMSALTGAVPVVALLVVVRVLSGLGRIVNEVVHPSLLQDYYSPATLPRVFQAHRLANPLAAVSGVVAGAIAQAVGWRWVFIVFALPTFVLIPVLLRLREPRRGETLDLELASIAESDDHIGFAEARRQLLATPTLRRLWVTAFVFGIGALAIGQFVSLLFEQEYGFGPTARGGVQAIFGLGAVVGLFVGGRVASRAMADSETAKLAVIAGVFLVGNGAAVALMALSPWAWMSLGFVFIAGLGSTGFQPAFYPLVGLVSAPRVRSRAYAWSLLFVGLGATLSVALFGIGDARGYRVALTVMALPVVLSGCVAASARRFVERDAEQARSSLASARELRAELERTGARALLSCRGVDAGYDHVQVLFGVDFEVRAGEVLALLGTNGAGKSTLLKAISGSVDPTGGAIFFDGRDITHADANQTVAMGIVQVPGGKAVFPTLTVAEHLRLAGWLYRDDAEYLRRATQEVYDTFPVLRERVDQLAGNLSGGEQQMLALGMAFIAKPRLLMIDELSLGLSPAVVEQLLVIVRRIQAGGTAIVLVEQSINVALSVADAAYFLEKGAVRFHGSTRALLDRDDIVRSVFLHAASSAATRNGRASARSDNGRRQDALPQRPLLEVEDLYVQFGGVTAVDGASFVLHEGEILGLIGANGAGKTTIFDVVSGLLKPTAGRVALAGREITHLSPDHRARLGLGRSFQDARLVPSLTVAENLAIGLERHLGIRDPVAAAFNLPDVIRQERDVAWTVADLVELMNLGDYRDKFVRELSTGSRRMVDLAICVALDPKVLLLDEPSSGIAQAETEALGDVLKGIRAESKCALLVIEHDMPLITSISERLIALDLGRPIAQGVPTEVIADPQVVRSYLGGDVATINRSGRAAARRGVRTRKSVSTNGRQPEPAVGAEK